MLDPLLVVVLAVEADADTNPGIVLDSVSLLTLFSTLFCLFLVTSSDPVCPTLNDEPALSSRHELFEDACKLFADLPEGTLNGLIFSLIEYVYQFSDTGQRRFEFLSASLEVFSLPGKRIVLLKRLFVDMSIAL